MVIRLMPIARIAGTISRAPTSGTSRLPPSTSATVSPCSTTQADPLPTSSMVTRRSNRDGQAHQTSAMRGSANQAAWNEVRLPRPNAVGLRDRRMAMARHASDPTHARPWIGSTLQAAQVQPASASARVAKAPAHHEAGMTIHAAIVVLAEAVTRATVHNVTMAAESGAATIEPGTTSGVIEPK